MQGDRLLVDENYRSYNHRFFDKEHLVKLVVGLIATHVKTGNVSLVVGVKVRIEKNQDVGQHHQLVKGLRMRVYYKKQNTKEEK